MRKKITALPEVFLSSRETAVTVSRMAERGEIRKIGPRLYTSDMMSAPETIVARNVWRIAGLLAPGSVVGYRTAFDGRPAPDGSVFLSGSYSRQIVLPGLVLRQIQGSGPLEAGEAFPGDIPFMGALSLASQPRFLLENLLPARRGDRVAKSVTRQEVEDRLLEILRVGGEAELNRLRDQARALAPRLQMEASFRALEGLIAALLRSRPVPLTSLAARAYVVGEPYDAARLPVFDALFAALQAGVWPDRPDRSAFPPAFYNVGFFDAYFSNYIEGTDFPVGQAIRIVFQHEIPANRPADAHDVLGTYRLVADAQEMRRRPVDFDDFVRLLKSRHAAILGGRPEKFPGQFKTTDNQAGATLFVGWDRVIGTLRRGFEMSQALAHSFARALFLMFLIAEVHPFTDGNGRMARVMMNAELIAAGQTRILIPSVFRNEYVNSLKRLTNHTNPEAFLRVMSYAQLFVAKIDFTDLEAARRTLAAHHAFDDPADDVKLQMPT